MTPEEYLTQSNKKGWKFNKIVSDPVAKNIQYINPLKQELVNKIVERAEQDIYVRKIIVFGSSITSRCNPYSDLDLCIDWAIKSHDEDGVYVRETLPFMKFVSVISRGNVDILSYDDINNHDIKKCIDEGIVVYEYDV